MLKVSLAILLCAQLMFVFGDLTAQKAFGIWGIMFMITGCVITIADVQWRLKR